MQRKIQVGQYSVVANMFLISVDQKLSNFSTHKEWTNETHIFRVTVVSLCSCWTKQFKIFVEEVGD